MTLKCFYCGRPANVEEKDGLYFAKCRYPRCKLQPETDWEPSASQVMLDWEEIKRSLKK
jgi:hypothetical protein